MGASLRPVGDLPASTYWRRRAVLGGGLLLLLFLLLRSCGGGGAAPAGEISPLPPEPAVTPMPTASSSAAPADGLTPSPSASASPTSSATSGASCPDMALAVRVSTDATVYPAGASPALRMSVRNTSQAACTREVGQAAVELLIYSGADRIWSSDDCAPGGSKGSALLAPGEERLITLAWSGRRSAPGCAGDKEPARPGTYRVVGRVGKLSSEGTVFRFQS